jgi:hypothetical protein
MTTRRFLAALTVAVVAVGVLPAPSWAGSPDIDVDHGNGHPGNGGGNGGGGGGGGNHGPVCVWQTATSQQVEATVRNAGVSGQIVREQAADPGIEVLVCDGVYDGRTWRTKPRPMTPQQLAALAYVHLQRNLPAPAVHTTPEDGVASIAKIPVFVWTDADQWHPLSFTETDPNGSGLAVTATATPSTMSYTPGDGSPAQRCTGPGAPFDPTHDGDPFAQATQPDRCAHAYTLVTRNVDHTGVPGRPDGWPAQVAVTWTVSWRATDGATGTLNPVIKSTGFERPVTEVQSLLTG